MGSIIAKLREWAVGPYEITKETGPLLVDKIKFRHYKPDELEIAKEFVRRALLPGTYFFDVYLPTTEVKKAIEALPKEYKRITYPGMLRIDAVCLRGKTTWIIEFKERFRPTGIGELMTYQKMFIKEYKPSGKVILAYVSSRPDPDLEKVLHDYGIIDYVVAPRSGKYA